MSITRIHTKAWASRIVIHKGVAYISGRIAADLTEDIQGQTRSTLAKIEALLLEADSDKEHMLQATIYLNDISNDFAGMNEVWNEWVPDGYAPARVCVQAQMAWPEMLVEISVITGQK